MKNLLLVLPSLGAVSLQIRTKLQKALKGLLNCCKLRENFKSQSRLSSVFHFKDQIPKQLISIDLSPIFNAIYISGIFTNNVT